jgi:hypothetical protein
MVLSKFLPFDKLRYHFGPVHWSPSGYFPLRLSICLWFSKFFVYSSNIGSSFFGYGAWPHLPLTWVRALGIYMVPTVWLQLAPTPVCFKLLVMLSPCGHLGSSTCAIFVCTLRESWDKHLFINPRGLCSKFKFVCGHLIPLDDLSPSSLCIGLCPRQMS